MIYMIEKYVWRNYKRLSIKNFQVKFENINLSLKIFLLFFILLFSVSIILLVLSQNLIEYYNGVLVKNDNGIFTTMVPLKYVDSFEKSDFIMVCGKKVNYRINDISKSINDTVKIDFSMNDNCFSNQRYFDFSIETFRSTLFNHFTKILKGET